MERTDVALPATEQQESKKLKRLINLYFLSVVTGTVMTISSLVALQTLQTSINIEGSTGSIAITSAYIGSIVYCLFVAPALTGRMGLGFSLVTADLCLAVYSLSNFYPELYVLVPGALFSSVSRATLLPISSTACFYLATMFSKLGSKPKEYYTNRYQGRLMSLFNTVAIVGNTLSFSILYAGSSNVPARDNSDISSSTTPTAGSIFELSSTQNASQYEHCGVNDCQDPEIVNESIDQYVPPNQTSVYILVFVTTLTCLVGATIHGLVYPGVGRFKRDLEQRVARTAVPREESSPAGSANSESITTAKDIKAENHVNEGYECDIESKNKPEIFGGKSEMRAVSSYSKIHNEELERNSEDLEAPANGLKHEDSNEGNENVSKESYVTTLKRTGRFFLQYKAILLSLTPMRGGMLVGFILSDVTRAYTSCVLGVEMTSLVAMLFGTTSIPVSLIYGRFAVLVGKNVFMAIGFAAEIAMYLGCYLWVPNPDTFVVVCFLFVGGGITNGVLKPLITTTYSAYFPKDRNIAAIVWNFWVLTGTGLQYGLSTTMCMVDKIYFNAAFSVVSVSSYALLELLQSRESQKTVEKKIVFEETRL